MSLFVNNYQLPSKEGIYDFLKDISIVLFPEIEGYAECVTPEFKLRHKLADLLFPIRERLNVPFEEIVDKFFKGLTGVKDQLTVDAEFIFEKDPASTSIDEVVMTYPGFYAILVYRISHLLDSLDVPLIPRIMTEYAHSKTGIDIHPKAQIESPFFIDHGTGIVIGETAIIGKRVQLYQGVTIGALSVKKEMCNTKRHPTIEENVIIYSGGTILGGETVIGHDSVIGGNVWLTESVPPNSLVYHQHVMKIKSKKS